MSIPELGMWLGENPWLALIGFIIGILGLVFGFYFYMKSNKTKLPCYSGRSYNVVEGLGSVLEPLKILYSGQEIKNLTITKIAFWNAGKDTIDYIKDIAPANPLIIRVVEGCKILDAKILKQNNPVNRFSINISNDFCSALVKFDYIDKDEGAVIQVIHTGKSNADLDLFGTIKGAGSPRYKRTRSPPIPTGYLSSKNARTKRYIVGGISLIIAAILNILAVNEIITTGTWLMPFVILCFLVSLPYWGWAYLFMRRTIPKGLDIFEESFK